MLSSFAYVDIHLESREGVCLSASSAAEILAIQLGLFYLHMR